MMMEDLYVAYVEGTLPDNDAGVFELLDEAKQRAEHWIKDAPERVVIIGRVTPILRLSLPPAEMWEEEL